MRRLSETRDHLRLALDSLEAAEACAKAGDHAGAREHLAAVQDCASDARDAAGEAGLTLRKIAARKRERPKPPLIRWPDFLADLKQTLSEAH